MMLHELFDKLAAVVEAPIDDVAERVTALGGTAYGTVRQAASGSSLPEFPEGLANEDAFTKALTQRYALAANAIRVAIDLTAAAGDADTADLFTGISRELDKALWFLEASA
jgi:starvation-inducible DNA-binding protein